MKKFLILGFLLVIIDANLFASIKKEVNIKQFLSELKSIQKQINKNKKPTKNIDNEIEQINKQKQYDFIVGNSKDNLIISEKIKKSISFLNNYLSLLNKRIARDKILHGDSYYKIEGISYLKVNENDVKSTRDKIFKEKFEILKIKKLLSLLKSLKTLDNRTYLSSQITLILDEAKNITNISQNNYNTIIQTNNENTKYQFCSINKKCFGYKVINITANDIVLDF